MRLAEERDCRYLVERLVGLPGCQRGTGRGEGDEAAPGSGRARAWAAGQRGAGGQRGYLGCTGAAAGVGTGEGSQDSGQESGGLEEFMRTAGKWNNQPFQVSQGAGEEKTEMARDHMARLV